jgi:hypothetical protein
MRRASVTDAENSPARAGGCDSEQGKRENELVFRWQHSSRNSSECGRLQKKFKRLKEKETSAFREPRKRHDAPAAFQPPDF